MKRFILLLFLIFGLSTGVFAQEEAYQSGDYLGAIAAYEARIASGESSGDLYYNLGNAYYQTGQVGLALLNYRRAEAYLPRDSAVDLQLARVQGEREDLIGAETDWLAISAKMSSDLFTIFELSILVFALWLLYWLLLAFNRQSLRWIIWLLGLVLLIGLFFLGTRLYLDNQQPEAIILADAVQVMSGPASDYLPLFILHEGAELRIIEQRETYYRFVLADGRGGWIEAGNLALINQ